MLQYIVKPIMSWPGELTPANRRKRSQFMSQWGSTLELLQREIRFLAGKNVIFQCPVREQDIRVDGGIKSNARPSEHPGVIITFDSKHGPLSYHSDQYTDFQSNVRAIALALEALRAVDRYGVNKAGTQYSGYKRLPPAGEFTNGRKAMTEDEAAAFVALHSGFDWAKGAVGANAVLTSANDFTALYKTAMRRLHPENKETGNEAAFVDLQEAAAILKKRHGLEVIQQSRDE